MAGCPPVAKGGRASWRRAGLRSSRVPAVLLLYNLRLALQSAGRPFRPGSVIGQPWIKGVMLSPLVRRMSWKADCLPVSEFPPKHKITMIQQNALEKWPVRRYFFAWLPEIKPTHPRGGHHPYLSRARGEGFRLPGIPDRLGAHLSRVRGGGLGRLAVCRGDGEAHLSRACV